MDKNLKNYLLHNLDFTDQEINNNYTLFYAAARIPDINRIESFLNIFTKLFVFPKTDTSRSKTIKHQKRIIYF